MLTFSPVYFGTLVSDVSLVFSFMVHNSIIRRHIVTVVSCHPVPRQQSVQPVLRFPLVLRRAKFHRLDNGFRSSIDGRMTRRASHMFDAINAAELLKVLTHETATVDLNDGTGSPENETVCRGFGECHTCGC